MKVKKTILAALTIVCALLLFSSCGKEKSALSDLYSYRAYGQISAAGGLGGMYSIGSFQSAINSVVGDGLTQINDAKVIAACDDVDAKIKADTGTKYSGNVQIIRSAASDDGNGAVIKTYTY